MLPLFCLCYQLTPLKDKNFFSQCLWVTGSCENRLYIWTTYFIALFFTKLFSYVFVILSFLSYFFFHFSVSSLDVFYLLLSIVLSFLPFSWTNIRRENSESLLEIKTRKIKAHETSRKLSVILISSFFFVLVLCFVPISLPSLCLLCYLLNHCLFTESR
jgi:cytochrome c biogenesis protein CcdA